MENTPPERMSLTVLWYFKRYFVARGIVDSIIGGFGGTTRENASKNDLRSLVGSFLRDTQDIEISSIRGFGNSSQYNYLLVCLQTFSQWQKFCLAREQPVKNHRIQTELSIRANGHRNLETLIKKTVVTAPELKKAPPKNVRYFVRFPFFRRIATLETHFSTCHISHRSPFSLFWSCVILGIFFLVISLFRHLFPWRFLAFVFRTRSL